MGSIEKKYFEEKLSEMDLDSSTVIMDASGQVLFSTLEGVPPIHEELADTIINQEVTKYQTGIFGGEKYELLVSSSEVTGFRFIRLVSTSQLSELIAKELRLFTVILYGCGVLCAIVLAWIIALYNYMPIKKLYRLFNKNYDMTEKVDELQAIKKYILNIQDKNYSLQQKLQDIELGRLRVLLVDLLYEENEPEEEFEELYDLLKIKKERLEYAIITLQLQAGAAVYDDMILEKCVQKLQERNVIYLTEDSERSLLFLCWAEKGKGYAAEKGRMLVDKLQTQGFMFRAGIGSYRTSFLDMRGTMQESILALELEPEQRVAIYTQSTDGDIPYDYVLPQKEERLLHVFIQKGNLSDVVRQLETVEILLKQKFRYMSRQEQRFERYRLVDYLGDLPGVSQEKLGCVVKELIMITDIDLFFWTYRQFLIKARTGGPEEVLGKMDERIQEMLKFIDEHFTDKEMSLTYMAEHFGLRETYFSTYFKKNVGVSFIAYVSEKRLEEARKRLVETDILIQEIIENTYAGNK